MRSHIGLLALVAAMSVGCSGSALQLHAQSAKAVRIVNDEAKVLVEQGCEEKSAAAAENTEVSIEQAAADSEAILETCRAIRDGQHLFAEAHTVWVMGLVNALSEDGGVTMESLVFLAIAAVRFYSEIIPLAARIEIHLPPVPDLVLQITGGGE